MVDAEQLCFLGLLGVLDEYACGALGGTRLRVTRLVIATPASLRDENLWIIRAVTGDSEGKCCWVLTPHRPIGIGTGAR